MKNKVFALLLFLICYNIDAQKIAQQYFLENSIQDSIERYYLDSFDYKFHSASKPFITGFVKNYSTRNNKINRYYHQFTEMDIDFPHNRYQFTALPIIDIEIGADLLSKKPISRLSAGVLTRMDINKDFSFQVQYSAGLSQTTNYISDFIKTYGVLPGEGRAYLQKNNTYAYHQLSGFLSYSPKRLINLQLGKGKHFIGNGYRSLLLSDVANNYPYFKLTTNPWHLQYSFMATWMKDLYTPNGIKNKYTNKFGVFHYLSWNATKWLNIGVFENVVWQGTDSNRTRNFDLNYLNPVIFFRPVEYSVGSSDNSMLGLNINTKFKKCLEFYGQIALDEFLLKEVVAQKGWWGNKYGLQAGAKYWVKPNENSTFKIQLEYNYVRPYTYSHGSAQQNYAHFNQALAHPFGSNFNETYVSINYNYKKLNFSFSNVYAKIGVDRFNENVGQNIFQSYNTRNKEFGNETGQGQQKNLWNTQIKASYLLVPALNIKAELAFMQYNINDKKIGNWQTPAVYFSLYSGIFNRYRDVFVN
jgi:hypothetical protein